MKNILTTREQEVAKLVSQGYTNEEIGKLLFVSKHTIKSELENIYRKTNIHNRVQLTIFAVKEKLINITD